MARASSRESLAEAQGADYSALMRILAGCLLLGLLSGPLAAQQRAADKGRGVALVVVIAVDQLRPDYFRTYDRQFTGGLRRLIDQAVLFERGQQYHAITETAPGHSTMLSGREPYSTGILNNTNGVEDAAAPVLGNPGAPGASPRRFLGTTLFDWMLAVDPKARQLAVSRKDRGAILMTGRAKGQVYWFGDGRFSTSRYYAEQLPDWVGAFNARRSAERLAGATWNLLLPASSYAERDDQPFERGGVDNVFPHRLPDTAEETARRFAYFPWMDSLTAEFALEGVRQLGLGKRGRPDLLTVSFSTTDAVGHEFGPDSRELHDHLLRLDRWLGKFLDSLALLVPAREHPGRAHRRPRGAVAAGIHPGQSREEGAAGRAGRSGRHVGGELAQRYRTDFGLTFDSGLALGRYGGAERTRSQRGQPGLRARGGRSPARHTPGLHPQDAPRGARLGPGGDALAKPDSPGLRLAHRCRHRAGVRLVARGSDYRGARQHGRARCPGAYRIHG